MSEADAHRSVEPSDEGGDPACWAHLFDPFGVQLTALTYATDD